MNKICYTCKKLKPFEDFYKNKRRKDGLKPNCKTCQSEYDKNYYKSVDKDKKLANVKIRIDKIRNWLEDYKKTQKCLYCGNNDFRVIEFHHIDNKKFNIGESTSKGYGIKTIIKEIEKCESLCANCHRILTYEERKKE